MEYTIYAIHDMETSDHGFGYLCILCQKERKSCKNNMRVSKK